MTPIVWPSRAEWTAEAEQRARTECRTEERVPRDHPALQWDPDVKGEVERDGAVIAAHVRSALTRAINTLQKSPNHDDERVKDLQRSRLALGRAAKAVSSISTGRTLGGTGRWLRVAQVASRCGLPAEAIDGGIQAMIVRLVGIAAERSAAFWRAATELEQAAVNAEVARRATDEAWEQELQRRDRLQEKRDADTPSWAEVVDHLRANPGSSYVL